MIYPHFRVLLILIPNIVSTGDVRRPGQNLYLYIALIFYKIFFLNMETNHFSAGREWINEIETTSKNRLNHQLIIKSKFLKTCFPISFTKNDILEPDILLKSSPKLYPPPSYGVTQ